MIPKNSVKIFFASLVLIFTSLEVLAAGTAINTAEAISKLTSCIMAGDNREASTADGTYGCCSASEGFCIVCPGDQSKTCTKHPVPLVAELLIDQTLGEAVVAAAAEGTPSPVVRKNLLKVLKNWIQRNESISDKPKKQ